MKEKYNVGNIVSIAHESNNPIGIVKRSALNIYDVVVNGEQKTLPVGLLLPIPLTEEWLLKFGFKKMVYNTKLESIKIVNYQLGNIVVYLLPTSFEIEIIALGEQNNLAINPKLEVHVLQNLYYALKGEELTLNKTK